MNLVKEMIIKTFTILQVIFVFCFFSFFSFCSIPEGLCPSEGKKGSCDDRSDCTIAYCAVSCSRCLTVYSKEQVKKYYCLIEEGGSVPRRCTDALKELNCPDVPPVCPPSGQPSCKEGKCEPKFE